MTGAHARPTGYPFSSIATGGLFRVAGTAATARGERPWSAFVKVLHHPRHWALIDVIPPAAAAEIKEFFPWRDELDVREQVLPVLPPGCGSRTCTSSPTSATTGLPAGWRTSMSTTTLGPTRPTHAQPTCWPGWRRRRTPGTAAGASDLPTGFSVRKVVDSRGPLLSGFLDDDALWARPLVADTVDAHFREDLRRAVALSRTSSTRWTPCRRRCRTATRPRSTCSGRGASPGPTSPSTGPSSASCRSGTTSASSSSGEVERGRMRAGAAARPAGGAGGRVRRRAGRGGDRRLRVDGATGAGVQLARPADAARGVPVRGARRPGDRRARRVPAAPRRSRPLRAGPGAAAGEWSRDASPSGLA